VFLGFVKDCASAAWHCYSTNIGSVIRDSWDWTHTGWTRSLWKQLMADV